MPHKYPSQVTTNSLDEKKEEDRGCAKGVEAVRSSGDRKFTKPSPLEILLTVSRTHPEYIHWPKVM